MTEKEKQKGCVRSLSAFFILFFWCVVVEGENDTFELNVSLVSLAS
jgi:hypothetical protein